MSEWRKNSTQQKILPNLVTSRTFPPTRISSYRSFDHDCQWRGSGHHRKRTRSCQCLDHRFHLRPPNCHCKSKSRRCQNRCVCRQKREAQEKEGMMVPKSKNPFILQASILPAKSKENLQKSSDSGAFKNRGFGVNPKVTPSQFEGPEKPKKS